MFSSEVTLLVLLLRRSWALGVNLGVAATQRRDLFRNMSCYQGLSVPFFEDAFSERSQVDSTLLAGGENLRCASG